MFFPKLIYDIINTPLKPTRYLYYDFGNKLGITSSAELATQEERLSKKRALELFESGMLDKLEAGTFKTLQTIHKQLFMDIYDFAGKVRSVNIAKGGFRFVPAMYLLDALIQIERMPQSTFDEIIENMLK